MRSAAARLPDPLRPADSAAAPLHPAFGPYARWYGHCAGGALPSLATLNAWAVASGAALADGRPIAFVAPPPGRLSALDYERWIARRGEIPTRGGSRHDACNALAWLAFPRAKSAVNAIHVAAANAPTANGRDRRRDAATLLDESGMIVACAEPALLALWREREWSALFWERRAEVARAMRPAALGHGLLARLEAPFRALTARALVVTADAPVPGDDPPARAAALDRAAAARLAELGAEFSPADLLPLPVAALPGWDVEGLGARLFDDASVFRPRAGAAHGAANNAR